MKPKRKTVMSFRVRDDVKLKATYIAACLTMQGKGKWTVSSVVEFAIDELYRQLYGDKNV